MVLMRISRRNETFKEKGCREAVEVTIFARVEAQG